MHHQLKALETVTCHPPKNHYKTAVNTQQNTLKHRSKNAFFKNGNFVARLFFEAIFERASQKEKK